MYIFRHGKSEIEYLTRRDKRPGRAIGEIGMIELAPVKENRPPSSEPVKVGGYRSGPEKRKPS